MTVSFLLSNDQYGMKPPRGLGYTCFTQKMKTLKIKLGYFRDKYISQPKRKIYSAKHISHLEISLTLH